MDDMQTVTVEPPPVDFNPPNADPMFNFDPGMAPIQIDPISTDPSVVDALGGSGGGGGGSTIASILQALGGGRGILSDASGIMGLLAANNLKDLASQAFSGSNPFGPYRQQYAQQLNTLMANPGSVTSDPGFTSARDASLQQVEKSMAAQGYKGSGNMAAALYDRSNQFQLDYTFQKENQLAELAGAGIGPNYGAALQGAANATGVQSSGLAALGAGFGYASPQTGMGVGSGSAGTPMSTKGFNSAGGEAATAITLANSGINMANNISNLAGGGNLISKAHGTVGGTIGEAGLGLGIYSGIKQGGVAGYTGAAADTAMLGSKLGLLSKGVGSAAGYIAAPLALYNFAENWKSGDTTNDTMSGAAAGAAIGSVVPVIGTAVGAVAGAAVGALSSLFGPGKKDPETASWDKYLPIAQKNPDVYKQVQNPFLLVAGLFDERSSTLPFYQQYGRMGEAKFTTDMTNKINEALKNGTISKSDTGDSIYSKVVAPWVNSMGTGWSNVGPEYTQAAQGLLKQMTNQYAHGQQHNWLSVGGDFNLPEVKQFGAQGVGAPTSPAPPGPGQQPALPGSPTQQPVMRTQPFQPVGNVMSQLAIGMQNNFRSLRHA